MNLKSITLHGFKSFADKTPIPLKDGFTAIIGPNGCGKSNVADAIRWTLGEQSAKSLRGKNMQDVIFSGTEKRRGMSYCEVSLTFDNTGQKIFPTIPFEEVIITRKLDRSGQSEYLINNAKCRRMDIINMLHDTGIGKEGYSIIGQGRVDEILSSKPEDRRNIFEEAAGISKFRAQRNEAEKKLESTQTNLNTIEEVIAEIERQLGPLRKQAEVVKKVEGLEEELKKQEVNLYIYNYENNESIKKGILDKKSEAQNQMKAKEAAYRGCSDEYDKSIEENSMLDKKYEEQAAELLSLKVDEEKSLGNANLIKEKVTNLQNEQNRLQEELRRTDSQLITSDQLIKSSKEKQDEKVSEFALKSKERDDKEKKLEQVSKNLLGQEGELERSNANFIQAMQELNMLKNNQSSFIANKSIDEERAKNLKGLLNDKKAKLDEENTAYTYHDAETKKGKAKMRELINEYNETLSNVNDAKEALKGLNEDIVSLQGRLSAAEGNYNLQLKIKDEYASFHEPVKRLMTDAKNDPVLKSKILGVTAEIISVSPEYQSAIDYALGNHIQCVLTENEHDVSGLIAYLKQKNYKRVTFRPRTACAPRPLTNEMRSAMREQGVYGVASDLVACKPEFKDFINSFLGGTMVVDTVYTAERLIREYGRAFKIVTLDGDIYEKSGDITGGSRRDQNSGLLSQENAIEQSRALVEKIKKQISQITQSREDRKTEIEESETRINELNAEISELRIANTLAENKAKQAFDNVETLKTEISETAAEYESVVQELKDLTEKLSSIDQLESDVKAKQEDYNAALETSKSQKGEQTDERETLVAEVMNLRVECSQIKSAIDNFEIELDRLRREQEVLQEEKLDLISEIKVVENNLENLMHAPEKSSFSESDLKRIKELEDAQANISNKKKELSENIIKLNELKEQLFNEKAELEQKCIRYDSMIERADDETRFWQEHILEEYDLTYSTAIQFKDPEFKALGAKTAIQDLKREISKCGQVNRLAVQTLKETEERYESCTSQRDDIKAACDDIMQVINELTTEMTDKFMAAFEKIKANFKEVFVELFGGGTGDLRLNFSETQDPLAAGIDIYAQPPGKNLRSITLLSGGERAFTAICILFAILKLKPMPFCVLDEIEAALDDSNANDFAAFLKRFSKQTQFIVITHRKPTMRHADSIFGITMEEKGITKVVSVEFTDAVKYASDSAASDEN